MIGNIVSQVDQLAKSYHKLIDQKHKELDKALGVSREYAAKLGHKQTQVLIEKLFKVD